MSGSSASSDDDDLDESRRPQVSLTGFLFGNVDTKTGKLENQSIFGADSDKQIKALENLGLKFQNVLADADDESKSPRSHENDVAEFQRNNKGRRHSSGSSEEDDYDNESSDKVKKRTNHIAANHHITNDIDDEDCKSPTAIDFSDISECIDEEDNFQELEYRTTFGDYNKSADFDRLRMPPPPAPFSQFGNSSGVPLSQVPPPTTAASSEKKLDTPLAAILPSKYANVSVTTLFPDFRPDKVLRFSRLFGPGKYHSLPHIWKNVKERRRRNREKLLEQQSQNAVAVNTIPGVRELPPETPKLNNGLPPLSESEKMEWESSEEDEVPDPRSCVPDHEQLFLRSHDDGSSEGSEDRREGEPGKGKTNDKDHLWRHGPAAIWFEMIGIPENPENFEYGFKKKVKKERDSGSESSDEENENGAQKANVPFPDDSYIMVTQSYWEEAIIWDGQDENVKKLVKNKAAGWVPSGSNRSVQNIAKSQDLISNANFPPARNQSGKSSKSSKIAEKQPLSQQPDDTWYSIFPVETSELVNGHWEKDIIWDVDNVEELPEPKVLELDPNDENIILCCPDDIDPNATQSTSAPVKVKIPHPHVKKSKILLGKAGVINVIEEDSPPPSPKGDDKDPYNLSLDEYYQAKHTEQALIKINTGGNIIQHSTPVVELRAPFIPTHMNFVKLRNFHRPAIRKLSYGPTSHQGPHMLLPLMKHIQRMAKQREDERQAAGGGEIFFMRTAEDFSGKDGELLFVEYCEEHPPLLSQVGMCSKIKNYYKRKTGKDDGPEEQKYGETVIAHTSPFLGAMYPGQMVQTLENNMYRSAIFSHVVRPTDFLVIRTRNNFFVRTFDAVFTAAQECPLYEVPGPNSKRANNFVRDFLQVFIHRLFWSSQDNPKRIRMDDIKKAFPIHSESSIRKRLKLCADFKRTGIDSNWWVIKPSFRLPTEEEIRAMVSPEQCCAYFSLVAAEQRLKDAGYGTQSILAPLPEDEDESEDKKLDDEVKVAPWNTTRAYIQAMRGKCILQINGPADPTGCGEGFSYIRMPNKPQTTVEEKETQPKRIVTGTDADLRRLSLNNAKALLRKFGVPEEEIQKLSRWEVIDVVRTLSTEKAKAGEEGMTKFSRGNRFSVAGHQERYKEECQMIFELQNRVLQSAEALSTDEEGESTEEEEDADNFEEMGKNIENMLASKKTSSQLSHEREEAERKELQRMLMGDGDEKKKDDEDNKNLTGLTMHPGRVLKIQRRYKTADGKDFIRNEIVRKSQIIDIYMRIRTTKDETFIRQFALLDDNTKDEMKKEKRRIQEQLRRIKRKQGREYSPKPSTVYKKQRKVKAKPDLKVKCGACGQVGHMRTNKACPDFEKNNDVVPSINVAMTEEEVAIQQQLIDEPEGELVKVDGTKIQLSAKLVKHTEEVKRMSLLIKVPRDAMKRKRSSVADHCDYLEGKSKSANRKRIDPQVVLSNIFEEVINHLRNHPEFSMFHFPVGPKVPRYRDIVTMPMDLQTIREKNRDKRYQTRSDLYEDLKLLVDNSILYNGENHTVTASALKLFEIAESNLRDKEAQIWKLEKQINPLLDENDKTRMCYIFKKVVEKVKIIPEALIFLKPVSKKVETYYDVISKPMDLQRIENQVHIGHYNSRAEFMTDIELIYGNAKMFNGPEHSVTKQAFRVLEYTRALLADYDMTLETLEDSIQKNDFAEEYEDLDSMGARRGSEGIQMLESREGSPEFEEEPVSKRNRRERD